MESKYIRADLLMNKIAESAFFSAEEKAKIRTAIEKEQGENVQTVVHAHWFTLDPNQRTGKAYKFACSNCERVVFTTRQRSIDELGYAFCPHCGAKMWNLLMRSN